MERRCEVDAMVELKFIAASDSDCWEIVNRIDYLIRNSH